MLDVISTFPFEYVLLFTSNGDSARYVMLFKLLKLGRLYETMEIIRKNSRHSYSVGTFFFAVFCLYGILVHFLACALGWVGRRSLTDNSRYDGKTLFKDFESRPFVTLGPLIELPIWD